MRRSSMVGRAVLFIVGLVSVGVALSLCFLSDGTIQVNPYGLATQLVYVIFAVILADMLFRGKLLGRPLQTGSRSGSGLGLWRVIAMAILALTLYLGKPLAEANRLAFDTIVFDGGKTLSSPLYVDLVLAAAFVGNLFICWCIVCIAFMAFDAFGRWMRDARSHDAVPQPEEAEGTAPAEAGSDAEQPGVGKAGAGQLGTLRICLILLVAWLPYVLVWVPGAVQSDMSRQLAEFFHSGGLSPTTHFPYFVSLVFGGLYQLGLLFDPSGWAGMWLMALAQEAIVLFVCTQIVLWCQRLGFRRGFVWLTLAFFALFPLVPINVVHIGKDGVHAFLMALFLLQLYLYATRRRRQIPDSRLYAPWAIVVCAILCALTRSNGIYEVAFALLVMAFLFSWRQMGAALAVVLVAYGCWSGVILPALGVTSIGATEALSLPAQIVAANLEEGTELTADEQAVLEDSFSVGLDGVAAEYQSDLSDPVKNLLTVGEDGSATVGEFCSVAFRLLVEHPSTSWTAALRTTLSWYPFWRGTYWSESAPYFCAPGDGWSKPEWFASVDGLQDRIDEPLTHFSYNFLSLLSRTFPLSILYIPGLYCWLGILVFAYALESRRSPGGRALVRTVFGVLAALVVLEAVLVFAPCASIRYALPMMFSLPVALMLVSDVAVARVSSSGQEGHPAIISAD